MLKNLSIDEYKNIFKYYKIQIPDNIYYIKKNANKIIINKMCISNCKKKCKYKYLLLILNKNKILSNNKKNKIEKTRKNFNIKNRKTRITSPINYL